MSQEILPFEKVTALTPKVMAWSPHIWLMDLSPCERYWQERAQSVGLSAMALVAQLLREQHELFWGAFSEHPWQALLLTQHVKISGKTGLLAPHDHEHVWRSITWSLWLEEIRHMARHALAVNIPGYKAAAFQRDLKQLDLTLKRLGQTYIHELQEATSSAMIRRFGSAIGAIWDWTRQPLSQRRPLCGFPWQDWLPVNHPQVSTQLEEVFYEWDHLAPFLIQDLDRLCRLDTWHPREKVLRLKWQLTLHDFSQREINIAFRNPHSLHEEVHHHQTTLFQAQFAFAAAFSRGEEDTITPILGWTIHVVERMVASPRMMDLFQQSSEDQVLQKILAIENKLPVPLKRFDACPDWDPADSFGLLALTSSPWSKDEMACPWIKLAATRPMYIYAQPKPITPPKVFSQMEFLERISPKWWFGDSVEPLHRDYYKVIESSHVAKWLFQDQQGKWFLHGLFG